MTNRRGVVAMTVPGQGHLQRMLPVVAGLCDLGIPVHFFAHEGGRPQIEQAGAQFVDLYANREMDRADAASLPGPIRCVSFAGYYGDEVVRQVAPLQPRLVLHDTFAVIGRVVARHLSIPRVNMRAGHNLNPTRTLQELQRNGSIQISPQCQIAVRALRERHGLADASPFSYFMDDSAAFNVYSEPPEFLPPDQRRPFEPLAFFGSYWPEGAIIPEAAPSPYGPDSGVYMRVYISFGTAIWRDCEAEAVAVLDTLATALAELPNVRALISLGRHNPPGLATRLTRSNVRVESYVNQIHVLRESSVYITHHGLNSTHEAIYHGVPMISYPFFADQPVLAARCQELGLAVPLASGKGQPVTTNDVHRAVAKIVASGARLQVRLAEARAWELAVIEQRTEVLRRIVGLMA
ncbi:Glycosyltransferase family 1 protein [Gammaproteobacteria bacterium]